MSHDEYEDAKAADFAANLQRLTMEQACVSAMSQELHDFKKHMDEAVAEKERQVRTEANMLNEFKQSLDKEAVERDTVKEQIRQLMIHNSQLKEYGRLEVESTTAS